MSDTFLPRGYQEPTFNMLSYILRQLNSGDELPAELFDAKQVTGGFVRSKVEFLHDGQRKKTIVQAFHIPDQEGKLHHYDLQLWRFKRQDKATPWEQVSLDRLDSSEIDKLCRFAEQQDEMIGKKANARYFKILASDSAITLSDLDLLIQQFLSNTDVDFSSLNEEEFTKIRSLIQKIVQGNNVLIDKEIYEQLIDKKTNQQSLESYREDLLRFRELIDGHNTTETDMQNFLEDKVWFFGLNYIQSHRNSKPKFSSGLGSQYDFLLEGFNQVYDIVELKGPNTALFEVDNTGNRERAFDNRVDYKFSSDFSRALHQVTTYIDEFEENFALIQENQPSIKNFMYPKGTIVLSKCSLFPELGRNSVKFLHLINRQFSNIEILTYDDLAVRADVIINFIEAIGDQNGN